MVCNSRYSRLKRLIFLKVNVESILKSNKNAAGIYPFFYGAVQVCFKCIKFIKIHSYPVICKFLIWSIKKLIKRSQNPAIELSMSDKSVNRDISDLEKPRKKRIGNW